MLLFSIWLHFGLFYSYSTLSGWFNFLDMKAVKELYERRQEEKIEGKRYLLYFAFIFGFNNHSVGKEILREYKWNGYVS